MMPTPSTRVIGWSMLSYVYDCIFDDPPHVGQTPSTSVGRYWPFCFKRDTVETRVVVASTLCVIVTCPAAGASYWIVYASRPPSPIEVRSEERRVGKEWRSRW